MFKIFSLAAVALVGAVLAVTVKGTRPELAVFVSIATSLVILICCVEEFGEAVTKVMNIIAKSGINTEYFKITLKACVIAYITQFISEICRDAGENAIAVKLETAGRISIMLLSMPVIMSFIDVISGLVEKV